MIWRKTEDEDEGSVFEDEGVEAGERPKLQPRAKVTLSHPTLVSILGLSFGALCCTTEPDQREKGRRGASLDQAISISEADASLGFGGLLLLLLLLLCLDSVVYRNLFNAQLLVSPKLSFFLFFFLLCTFLWRFGSVYQMLEIPRLGSVGSLCSFAWAKSLGLSCRISPCL